MRKVVQVTEVDGEGFDGLLGQKVTIFANTYIYTGILEGVNESCIKLTDAAIVYETGAFSEREWKDAQSLPNPIYIQMSAIESFTVLK